LEEGLKRTVKFFKRMLKSNYGQKWKIWL
jgi:hypothetical protein